MPETDAAPNTAGPAPSADNATPASGSGGKRGRRRSKSSRKRVAASRAAALGASRRSLSDLGETPIVLIGMMGVGKTTVGRRLAKKLGRDFADSDEEIERASGRTVSGYFRDHGEAAFRDGERRVIERLITQTDGPGLVLATGGGAFIDDATRALLREKSLVIWLKADFDTVMERVSRNDKRPLLQVADPAAKVRELMDVREPIYAKAHVRVNVARGPHVRTVGRIEREVAKHLTRKARRAERRAAAEKKRDTT